MKPKLHEVARLAEVSEATVSRVMNGKPGVAEATRRKVLDALSQLGYRPEGVRNGAGVIGIITPELDNPIFPLFAQQIESRLARHDLLSVVAPATPTTAHERDYLDHFAAIGAAGVVIINGSYAQEDIGYAAYQQLLDDGMPTVLVNGIYLPCPVPAVGVDIAAAAGAAVRHLFNLGHTRIGCLTGPLYYSSGTYLVAGYEAAMERVGLEVDDDAVIETLYTVESAHAATSAFLDAGITGVVAGSDLMALGVIGAAKAMGRRVPQDLSVVGFDGTPLVALGDPPLTTLRQPVGRMARAVTTMLTAQFAGDTPAPQVFQAELVAGATTGAAPALVH